MSKMCKRTVNYCKFSLIYRLFTPVMKSAQTFRFVILNIALLLLPVGIWAQLTEVSDKMMKVALRDAGNQLLLSQKDSTTRIAPVRQLSDSLYELSFGSSVSFEPSALVSAIEESLKRIDLENKYTVEVKRCADREVVYSYLMTNNRESTIVPCLDRPIARGCYLIELEFSGVVTNTSGESKGFYGYMFYGFLLATLFLAVVVYIMRQGHHKTQTESSLVLGKFHFIPDQLKLVREAEEITLSKKECEILELLVTNINDIVTRDELSKRIWEDNGVVVGRSLDTYISKLRKKLQSDSSIKISNVHGVGYRLEEID